MRKNKWMLGIVWLLLLLFSGMTALAANQPWVFDQAALFSDSQAEALTEKAASINDSYQMNMVIVTTAEAEGKTAEAYADDFYMDHGFYSDGQKGGVLFLIDMDNSKVWLATFGDMIYYLTDERVDSVIDAGYGEVTEGAYHDAVMKMMDRTVSYIEKGIPADQYTYDRETGKIVRYRSLRPIEILISVLAALLAGGLVCAGVIGKYRLKWGTYKYPFREKSTLALNRQEDRFINQVVTTRRIPKNPPSSGGGGSRSTTHTSSGGGRSGGGGRSF